MTELNYAKHQPTRRKIILRIIVLFVAAALTATAQIPMHRPIGECSTVDATEDDSHENAIDYQRSEFKIPGDVVFVPGTLCSFYSYVGWEEHMKLYLGEGADEYRDLIELAIEVWNETVHLRGDWDWKLIEITDERPENYRLPTSFWSNTDEYGHENLEDDESVIYFTPSGEDETNFWGLTWSQRQRYGNPSMQEADIYINARDEESHPGRTLMLTKKLVDVNRNYGAYALYNKTYAVILHELGHAVGLKHIPVSGNIMSRDFGAGGLDQWAAPIALELLDDFSPTINKFVYRHSEIFPYMSVRQRNEEMLDMMDFFTENAKLGEQEKMALTCIYEY